MWVVWGILLGLAALIVLVLLLPVNVLIKNDADNRLTLLVRILHITFGKTPKPQSSLMKKVKQSAGLSKADKKVFERSVKDSGLLTTVQDTCRVLLSLLQQTMALLRKCTLKTCKLTIICTGEDAAHTAVSYGQCCAVAYPLLAFIDTTMKVKKRGQDVRIDCDYSGRDSVFLFEFVLSVRVCHILAAFIRIAYKEAIRTGEASDDVPPRE